MTGFAALFRRNRRDVFRSPWAPLYIAAPLVILAVLYPLWITGLHADAAATSAGGPAYGARLAAVWTAAGVPVTLSFTAAVASLVTFVRDMAARRTRDFGTTLLGAGTRAVGYASGALLSALGTAAVSYACLQAAVHIGTGVPPVPRELLFGLGYTLLGAANAASLCLLAVSVFRGAGVFVVLAALTALLPGFLTGAFIPVGALQEPWSTVIQCFPPSHAVLLARQTLTWRAASGVFGPKGTDLAWYQSWFGIVVDWMGQPLAPIWSLAYLSGSAMLSLAAAFPLLARACRPERLFKDDKERRH